MNLLPTHSCFDDALEFIDYVIMHEGVRRAQNFLLVHGLCEAPDGLEYAHAWVEETILGVAVFAGIVEGEKGYMGAKLKDYYKTYRVKELTRYTMKEACEQNLKHNNYGPWKEEYIVKCGQNVITTGVAGDLQCFSIGKLPDKQKG